MSNEVTDAISEWLQNDPDHYDEARSKAREGHDYLRDFATEVLEEATEEPEPQGPGTPGSHGSGPAFYVRREWFASLGDVDWEEVADVLWPLPNWERPDLVEMLRGGIGNIPMIHDASPTASWRTWLEGVVIAYEANRKDILWAEDPQDDIREHEPQVPSVAMCWKIWADLSLWDFDADIAYSGFPFKEEDYEHGTVSVFKLQPEIIERRVRERISDIPRNVVEEIQNTIMGQLWHEDNKQWEA